MNVFVTLNVTSDHLEVSETVLLYAMATVKRELFQKKKLKLIIQDSFQSPYLIDSQIRVIYLKTQKS